MNCFCGQINMARMMNPYINPFMGMRMGVGMFSPTPAMSGVPYCSMINNDFNQTPIIPYMGMNSIFGGGMMVNPFMFGVFSPIPSIMNLGQQIFNTGNRIGQAIQGNYNFSESSGTNTPVTESLIRLRPKPSAEQTNQNGNLSPGHATSPNGTCRPAAGRRLGRVFLEEVKRVAQRINCDYRDLLAVMNSESGLNPQAVNPQGGATGLIQFMPSTAQSLGTTTTALKNMSAIEQLKYVEKFYLLQRKGAGFDDSHTLNAGDLYALTFLPARAKREVLCERGEGNNYYEWNTGADTNKDGKITKSELAERVQRKRVDETIFV